MVPVHAPTEAIGGEKECARSSTSLTEFIGVFSRLACEE